MEYGTDLPYLKSLVEYWRDGYDWRKHEAQLNGFKQYKVQLAGIDLHFIREEGKGPKPMPLLISHGWPGSVHEFHKILPMLTDPARFGGDPADAFTVIAPSLPGYAFSFTPNQPRFSVEQIADVFAELMTDVLGYKRFAAQGGDWGGFVTSRLGYAYPERLAGIHLNLLSLRRDTALPQNPTEEEKRYFEERAHWMKEEVGYTWIQGTKPQTLAYGLTDSPVGLAAWIVEKFHTWSDHRGDLDGYLGRDDMLTNIMLYWVTGAIGSSFWPYYARMHGRGRSPMARASACRWATRSFRRRSCVRRAHWRKRCMATSVAGRRCRRAGTSPRSSSPNCWREEMREFFRPLR